MSTSTKTVRERREALGLTQEDLATKAKVSVASVRLFDRGYVPASGFAFERVLRYLARREGRL